MERIYSKFFIILIHPKIEIHKIILKIKPLKTPIKNLFSTLPLLMMLRIGK